MNNNKYLKMLINILKITIILKRLLRTKSKKTTEIYTMEITIFE